MNEGTTPTPLSTQTVRAHGDGKDAITDAAREAFAEVGYHGTSIRDIAQRANITMSVLYHYYASKHDLLYSLITISGEDFIKAMNETLAETDDDPADRLAAMVRTLVEYRVRRRVESILLLTELHNLRPEARELLIEQGRRVPATMGEIIDAGIAAGVFTTPFPVESRRAIFAMCNSIARWYRPEAGPELEELVRRHQLLAANLVGQV